ALQFQLGGHKYSVTAYGRNDPNGDVEQLRISAGRWPAADDEMALALSYANLNHISVGDRIKVVSVQQEPVLTVVALVVDIDEARADVGAGRAWVLGSAIAPLTVESTSFSMMDYRFAGDPTSAQLQAATNALRGSLPPGSITTSTSQLLLANSSTALGLAYQSTYSPVLDALALVGALLVVTAAALIPALRAGLLKPAVVIANATAPRGQSGRWLRRLASRVGLPRSI